MAPSTKTLSPSQLEAEVREIFAAPTFDLQKETQKTLREQVTKRLGLKKFPSDQRETLKQIVTRLIQEEQQQEEEESSAGEEEEEEEDVEDAKPKSKKKKSQSQRKPVKKSKSSSSSSSSSLYSSGVQSLLQLGQAMRLGPRLHMGLKDLPNDQERISLLTERLKEAGASWKGKLPTQQDIAQAKAEKQRKDDLDGIDASLILGGRGRRRRGEAVNYAVDVEDEEDEEEEKREVDEGEQEERPRKKPKETKKAKAKSSDAEESEESAEFKDDDASEESEAEFE